MRTTNGKSAFLTLALAALLAALPVSAQQHAKKAAKLKQNAPAMQQAAPNAQAAPGEEAAPNPADTAGGAEAATPPEGADGRRTSLVSRLMLKVVSPDDARAVLEKKAAELGGFPTLVEDAALALKVPPDKLSEAIAFISSQGLVIEKTLERADLTQEIARLEGQLASKRETLSRLRGFFDDSNAEATLRIEQTMTDIVAEIEQVKGQLRVAEERSKWAVIEISFQFRERDRIIYVSSPFDWLNSVGLTRFEEEF
jgi:hypothetical protein